MTGFWRTWIHLWCVSVGVFGLVLTLGAYPPTDAPTRLVFDLIDGPRQLEMTDHLRFSLAVMGPVTLGWCLTLFAAINAAEKLPSDQARSVWHLVTAGVLVWFVIDSILSVATGFSLNIVPNTILLVAYLLPLFASGVLRKPAA